MNGTLGRNEASVVTDEQLGKCLHGHFATQAAKTPERTALIGREGSKTYRELDDATDRLACMLLDRGVVKDSCVGILMERCNEYPLAYIAIHKAGGAYLPLDPAYPKTLLQDVLQNSQPTVVLCAEAFVNRIPPTQQTIVLTSDWASCLDESIDSDALENVDDSDLDSLAYIVYSSGTTGKPKGIACPHRGAVFSYLWRFDNIPYAEYTTTAATSRPNGGSSRTSDAIEVEACNVFFVWEMLRPLLRGQTLCVIPDDVIYDPVTLSSFLQEFQVTRMLFTPSLLEAVLDSKTTTVVSKLQSSLRTIILCGEVVTVALQERIKKLLPQCQVWNLYSVSECHDVAALDLTKGNYQTRKYCPVGKLLKGVDAYVMDAQTMTVKATGQEGELFVAGPTLARGYVGLDELTVERFPTVNGVRLYKTGDRARVLPNRELEILGRCDSMVKVRGYSVELRAIEAAILSLNDLVSSCCVVVQGDEGDDKFVIAYIVLVLDNPDATCRNVRLALKSKLPHYMVPAFLVDMNELPTHEVSGKLDKKALPAVDLSTGHVEGRERLSSSQQGDCTLPRNEIESQLHTIWCELMNMHQIDVVYDSFFDIGGHSLLAARLVQRVQVELGTDVGVVELFSNATIEALANVIIQKQKGGDKGVTAPPDSHAVIDLDQEVKLHDTSEAVNDMAMRAFWRSTHFSQVRERAVLLTGGTGFLGSYLLHELLQNEDIDVIYCLVRGTSHGEAASRLQTVMQERQLWEEDFATRLHVFAGDASLHHLGLDDDDYAMLGTIVDVVVHCAALVNLVYPYEGLRSANVQGTRNVIEFALHGRVKKLVYISTDGIFPDGLQNVPEDVYIEQYSKALGGASGYSQSKWVAEMLVRHARDQGLPSIVFRPGNMGGVGAIWNPSDFNFLVLLGCIAVGAAPQVDGWVMEMTPVDFAAKAMVHLMSDNTNLGSTFHVTNFGNCCMANEYFESLRESGFALQSCSLKDWRNRVLSTDTLALQKLRNAIQGGAAANEDSLRNLSTFLNANFATKCAEINLTVPKISKKVMQGYVAAWRNAGLIAPRASANNVTVRRSLAGKVAVVTGAGSGLGAAIARVLSMGGARVGIGGRRLGRLQELASELNAIPDTDTVHASQVDVTDRQDMERFCKDCESFLGGSIDIFVNNAGVMHYGRLEAMHEDQWHKEVDVNIKGLLHATACVLPGMLARGNGHIVCTSSDAGRKVFPGLAVYSATKYFVEAFCQGMRVENADRGLRVTTIQPGDCKTELSQLTTDEAARSEFAQQSNDREFWLDPEDVAEAVLYAVTAPSHVGINEILIEPRGAPA